MKTGRSSREIWKNVTTTVKDNRGISLTELMVIIAIVAVLSGGVFMMIGTLTGWRVRECSDKLTAAMSETKVQAMSKTSAQMTLSFEEDQGYILDKSFAGQEKIAGTQITITYSDSAGNKNLSIKNHPLTISYDRSSGSFQSIGTDESGNALYCSEIVIQQGKRERKIVFYTETGKYKIAD